jgi:hypothetical protein
MVSHHHSVLFSLFNCILLCLSCSIYQVSCCVSSLNSLYWLNDSLTPFISSIFTPLFLYDPIVLEVTLETIFVHDVFEKLSQVLVVWFLLKLKVPAIVHVLCYFIWETSS